VLRRVRWSKGYYISQVRIHPYFSYQLRYVPCWPWLDPRRGDTIEIGAPISTAAITEEKGAPIMTTIEIMEDRHCPFCKLPLIECACSDPDEGAPALCSDCGKSLFECDCDIRILEEEEA
jgi:hypothetical protein